jgi:hypothetical protein
MGLNAAARLRAGNIDAKKTDAISVPARAIFVPPKGHPLAHPRFADAVDPSMRDDILDRGVEKPIRVRDDGEKDGTRVLLLVDGGRRLRNTLAAEEKAGTEIRVPIEFFTGDDAAVIRERLRANSDPLKKPDAPSILAKTVRQYMALRPGAEPKEIARELADVMPRGVGATEIDALGRWNNLTAEARALFDDGTFPLCILAAVLDAPRDEQVEKGHKLVAAGVRTVKGATRKANAEKDTRDPWARRMTPRQADRIAEVVMQVSDTKGHAFTAYAAMKLVNAKGHEAADLLAKLPKPIADAIREARAAKPARESKTPR